MPHNMQFPRPGIAADSVISLHELESIQREISKHSKGSMPKVQTQTRDPALPQRGNS